MFQRDFRDAYDMQPCCKFARKVRDSRGGSQPWRGTWGELTCALMVRLLWYGWVRAAPAGDESGFSPTRCGQHVPHSLCVARGEPAADRRQLPDCTSVHSHAVAAGSAWRVALVAAPAHAACWRWYTVDAQQFMPGGHRVLTGCQNGVFSMWNAEYFIHDSNHKVRVSFVLVPCYSHAGTI